MAIQPKKFSFKLDIRGVDEEVVAQSPDGWLNINIKYARSKVYSGVIRSLTLPLKFLFTGAFLLRREFYQYGLLARVNLYIYKLDPATWLYVQLYFGKIDFSKWQDELTGVSINATENNINVQIAAYADQLYAVPTTVTEANRTAWIAKTGVDPMVDILLTPLQLEETADLIFASSPDFRANAFFSIQIADYQQMSINSSVQFVGFLAQVAPDFSTVGYNFFHARTDTKVRINSGLDPITLLPIPGNVQTSINGNCRYQFNIYNQNGTLLKTLAQSPAYSVDTEFTFEFDFALDVAKDDKLFFYILNLDSTSTGGSSPGVKMQNGSMSLTYYTITPASNCQALRANYVFDYLVQQMNGTENPTVITQSFLLAGELSQLCITCSNAILTSQQARLYQAGDSLQIGATYLVFGGIIHYVNEDGVSTDYGVGSTFKAMLGFPSFTTDSDQDGFVQQQNNNPQLIYSFNTFFKSIYSVMGGQAGAGLDPMTGRYALEELSFFYRQTGNTGTPALDLGVNIDNKSPKIETNTDVAVNAIKVGYNDQQYNALNAGQEVCSTQEYTTLITSPKAELDLVSPTRSDPYGIEERRILPGYLQPSGGLSGQFYLNSASSRSDNDNFFVWVKALPETGQTYYQPVRTEELMFDTLGNPMIYGVDPSYYNWRLSPKQNLLRGGSYLSSIFDNMGGYSITLSSALKNANMITIDLAGNRVAESDPIAISNLPPQIFKPYYSTVNTGLVFNAEQLLSTNPYGEIWYSYRGITWKGFIQEVSVDAGENTMQTFKLLLSPANDLSKMVF